MEELIKGIQDVEWRISERANAQPQRFFEDCEDGDAPPLVDLYNRRLYVSAVDLSIRGRYSENLLCDLKSRTEQPPTVVSYETNDMRLHYVADGLNLHPMEWTFKISPERYPVVIPIAYALDIRHAAVERMCAWTATTSVYPEVIRALLNACVASVLIDSAMGKNVLTMDDAHQLRTSIADACRRRMDRFVYVTDQRVIGKGGRALLFQLEIGEGELPCYTVRWK